MEKEKYKSRYKIMIRNLSYNGHSKVSFKNLSNDILDDLFKEKQYNSYYEPRSQRVKKEPKKTIKFNNVIFYNSNNI